VLPTDVNCSQWDCTLEGTNEVVPASGGRKPPGGPKRLEEVEKSKWSLRLGLRMIAGLSQVHAERIVAARGARPFRSMDDFARRTGLTSSVLACLSRADTFHSLGLDRRGALWQSLPEQKMLPLFDDVPADEPAVPLP